MIFLKEPMKYVAFPMIDVILENIIELFSKCQHVSVGILETHILVPHVHIELHKNCLIVKTLKVYELNIFEL